MARVIRSQILTVKQRPFVQASILAGMPGYQIISPSAILLGFSISLIIESASVDLPDPDSPTSARDVVVQREILFELRPKNARPA